MIDKDLFDLLDAPIRESVEQALISLSQSGIFKLQRERNVAQLMHGYSDSDEQLLERVKLAKEKERSIVTLEALGNEISQQYEDKGK